MNVRDRIAGLTDLFMGALWADEEFSEDEQKAVRQLLADLLELTPSSLPANVEDHITRFDPLVFDLDAVATDFADDAPSAKLRLLELVGRVANSDGVLHLKEEAYLRQLAALLGVEYDDFSKLTFDYEVDELRASFEGLRAPPPPMVNENGKSSRPPPPPMVPLEPPAVLPPGALVHPPPPKVEE